MRHEMRFKLKKIPKEQEQNLRPVPVRFFRSFVPWMSPVYVYLPKNQKYVAIKSPLGFFTPEEIEKFGKLENLYLPAFVDQVVPFQKAGDTIRRMLSLTQKQSVGSNQGPQPIVLPMAPYELSDAILKVLAPLWGKKLRIEPFFVTFLSSQVCELSSGAEVNSAYEKNVDLYELALLRSSLAVFLALHLGFLDRTLLLLLRARVFSETLQSSLKTPGITESDQICEIVKTVQLEPKPTAITREFFAGAGTVRAKLRAKLDRIAAESLNGPGKDACLDGEGGILD